MRWLILALLAVGFSVKGWAQEAALDLGTKPEIVTQSAGAPLPTFGHLIQMVMALALVGFGIKWILPKFAGKLNRTLSPEIGSSIRIEESAQFAGGTLYIVSARERHLLVSVSPQGVSCLADLTPLPGAPPEAPAFFEMLDEAKTQVSESSITVTQTDENLSSDEKLARLRKLIS